jgi:hypothetical protein
MAERVASVGESKMHLKNIALSLRCGLLVAAVICLGLGAESQAASGSINFYWKNEREVRLWLESVSAAELVRAVNDPQNGQWSVVPKEAIDSDAWIDAFIRTLPAESVAELAKPDTPNMRYWAEALDFIRETTPAGGANNAKLVNPDKFLIYSTEENNEELAFIGPRYYQKSRWSDLAKREAEEIEGSELLAQFFELNSKAELFRVFQLDMRQSDRDWATFWKSWMAKYRSLSTPWVFPLMSVGEDKRQWLLIERTAAQDFPDLRFSALTINPGPSISSVQLTDKQVLKKPFLKGFISDYRNILTVVLLSLILSAIGFVVYRLLFLKSPANKPGRQGREDNEERPDRIATIQRLCEDIKQSVWKENDSLAAAVRDIHLKSRESGMERESDLEWIGRLIGLHRSEGQALKESQRNIAVLTNEVKQRDAIVAEKNGQIDTLRANEERFRSLESRWKAVHDDLGYVQEIQFAFRTDLKDLLDYTEGKASEIPAAISFLVFYSLHHLDKAIIDGDQARKQIMVLNLQSIADRLSRRLQIFNNAEFESFKHARDLIKKHFSEVGTQLSDRSELPHEYSRLFQALLRRLRDSSRQLLDFSPYFIDIDKDGRIQQARG